MACAPAVISVGVTKISTLLAPQAAKESNLNQAKNLLQLKIVDTQPSS